MKSGISRLALASSSFLAIGVSLAAAQSVIVQVDTSSAAAAIEELADAFAIEQLNEGDEAATIADEITDGLFAMALSQTCHLDEQADQIRHSCSEDFKLLGE